MIGVSESKVDSTVLDPEIGIENYKILRFERKRYGRSVACDIKGDISCKLNAFLPNEIENIIFNILMPHTKLITIVILYKPQSNFINIFEENLPQLNTSYHEIY